MAEGDVVYSKDALTAGKVVFSALIGGTDPGKVCYSSPPWDAHEIYFTNLGGLFATYNGYVIVSNLYTAGSSTRFSDGDIAVFPRVELTSDDVPGFWTVKILFYPPTDNIGYDRAVGGGVVGVYTPAFCTNNSTPLSCPLSSTSTCEVTA